MPFDHLRCSLLASAFVVAFPPSSTINAQDAAKPITVSSPAFKDGQPIPEEYTAYGEGKSIPLSWSNLPAGTRSIAVVLDDPGRAETIVSRVNVHAGNPFTRFVARDIAQRVAADDRWRRVFSVDSRYYGRVAGYRNRTLLGRGYHGVLESHGLFSSPIDP